MSTLSFYLKLSVIFYLVIFVPQLAKAKKVAKHSPPVVEKIIKRYLANTHAKMSTEEIGTAFAQLLLLSDSPAKLDKKGLDDSIKLMMILLRQDPYEDSVEMFYPIYKARKSEVDEVLKSYKAEDQNHFRRAMRSYLEERKKGNG